MTDEHWTREAFIQDADIYLPELKLVDGFGNQEVEAMLDLLNGDVEPSSVLDVGCGIGRHARRFAAKGVTATGIDISPTFLSQARELADEEDVNDRTDFRRLDMRKLHRLDKKFDLIICIFNTIGYFEDDENVEVLRKMHDRLREGGYCIVQVANKDALLKELPDSLVKEMNESMVVEQYEFDSFTSRVTKIRDLFQGGPGNLDHLGRTEYQVRNYSPPEIERILGDAGFEDISLFGGFDMSPVTADSDRIVALAQ